MTAPNPIAFSIFGIDIRWYGILVGLAFLIAVYLSYRRAPIVGLEPDHVLDFCIFMIPLSIIGARLYYVIFEWEYYAGDIKKIIDLRSGGLAIHGGLIAGLLVAWAVSRYHKFKLRDLVDDVFPNVALGQAIGRWGNFFNSEAHGGPTDLPWGIMVDGVKVHPTFLYESIWCLLIFIFLTWFCKRRKFSGQVGLLYGILYSAERFFVESLRTDSLMIGPFKQAQVLSLCVIIVCLLLYYILNKRSKNQEKTDKES
ncbi:MAG: prolipoprotein diacylglyceryl transferase [Firmicutes bacterium]|nr:prolipoprotein diacylglyceryl transferase [Bacillota bacterium]